MKWEQRTETLHVLFDQDNIPLYGITMDVVQEKYMVLNLLDPPYISLVTDLRFENVEDARNFVESL